jgi:DegV family protein with EDD domain
MPVAPEPWALLSTLKIKGGSSIAKKVAIVADSLGCLTRELVDQYDIKLVPANIYFEDKVYKDWVDITPTEAYELFLKNPEGWTTSPAPPEDWLETYRQLSQQTKSILCITISSKLSAMYNVARQAKEQVEAEIPGVAIEVLDSQLAVTAEGLVILAAARAAEQGKSLTEVVKAAEEMRDKVDFIFLLDTVRYIYRTGRIPKIAAQAGSILNIKPLLTTSSGVVRFIGAVRSREHGIERMLDIMRDKVGQAPVHVVVTHAYALEEAQKLKERVSAEFNCTELWISQFSPILGYATGTGTLGLAFYKED